MSINKTDDCVFVDTAYGQDSGSLKNRIISYNENNSNSSFS